MSGTLAILANDALLLLTAGIWGFAFVAQRVGMAHVGPFTYTAIRFALGALAVLPLAVARRRAAAPRVGTEAGPASGPEEMRGAAQGAAPDASSGAAPGNAPGATASAAARPRIHPLPAGLIAGAVLTGGSLFQQVGLVTSTAGKGGFITGLYVVLVPLAGLLWGQRAGWPRWVGAVLAAGGLYLLSVTGAFTIQRGDLLVLIGSLFWAAHVLVVGWLSPRTDVIRLACVQFAVCAVLSGLVTAFVERPTLEDFRAATVPILYGGLLSVGVGLTLQVAAQRRAPPAHAALLLSLESVFAALGGWLLLGERLGPRGLAGCALMFAGMICAQLPLLLRLRGRAAAPPQH